MDILLEKSYVFCGFSHFVKLYAQEIKMARNLTPITLLCGYLGAGKTTLMNKVLTNQKGYKVAVIVNDIGEVNVDETLIAKGANITDTSSIIGLQNGCICCTLKSDLVQQIEDLIKTGRFDYILIEASGVCEPMPIAQAIEQIRNGKLDNVVSVVDAKRLVDEFAGGDKLLDKNMGEEDIESLLVQQIEFCSTLIINKKDLVSEDEMKKVRAVVNALQPHVKVIETSRGDVDVSDILSTERFDFDSVFESAAWVQHLENADEDEDEHDEHHEDEHAHEDEHGEHHHEEHHGHDEHEDDYDEHGEEHHHHGHHHHEHNHKGAEEDEYGIGNFVYYRRRPFSREKLEEYAGRWPRNIIRCKGVLWFSDEQNMAYVFETSGRQISAGASGIWLAAASKKEQDEVLASEPKVRAEWDEKVGDRMVKLCIIGQNLDKAKITEELDSLLD